MIISKIPDFVLKSIFVLIMILLALVIYYLINIGNKHVSEGKKLVINNKKILIVIFSVILLYSFTMLLRRYQFISDIFTTIIASIIIAYALNPIIDLLERKNIKRFFGVFIVYLSIAALIIILAVKVIPNAGNALRTLIANLPSYVEQLSAFIDSLYTGYYSALGGLPSVFEGFEGAIMDYIVKLEGLISESLSSLVGGVILVASKIVSLVLTPILVLYFLVHKKYFKEIVKKLIPRKYRDDTLYLASVIDVSLKQFIKARLIMSLYVGVLTAIVLKIMGIDFAITIGIITGLADIVPYIGPFLGYIPAVFFAAISDPIKIIWISILWVFIQWTENNVLAPKVIGENMGIHPLLILLSIIIGGGIFGVFGMILAVPLVAIFKIVTLYIIDKNRQN